MRGESVYSIFDSFIFCWEWFWFGLVLTPEETTNSKKRKSRLVELFSFSFLSPEEQYARVSRRMLTVIFWLSSAQFSAIQFSVMFLAKVTHKPRLERIRRRKMRRRIRMEIVIVAVTDNVPARMSSNGSLNFLISSRLVSKSQRNKQTFLSVGLLTAIVCSTDSAD